MKALVIVLTVLSWAPKATAGMREASAPEPPPTPGDIFNQWIVLQGYIVWTAIAMIALTWITWWGIRMIRRSHA